ncbi:MAG TPA: DUF1835 domain-containing protein [Chitinophagaceae bacterium]|jgi:hypothetical protein|nr:DUF1835 domain-containing protein [Chitinophagaceae bacterium]
MIHIVFQQDDVDVLKKAMELDGSLQGKVFEIKDEWGVGSLKDLDTDEGWQARENWWRELLKDSPYGEKIVGSFDDRETVKEIKHKLDTEPSLEAWIWMGQNQHDVTGYFWLMRQLRDYQGRAMILYLNNLPFINEKGQLFYPWNVHDILPKEIIKAKKLARPITMSEFEVDPDEWKRLSEENAPVRILEGGKKIVSKDETFYDEEVMKNITAEWQKAWRVLSNTLHRMKIKTGDVFLMWRMKELITQGKIEVLGDVTKGWKEFDVKLPGAQMESSNLEAATANNQ